MADRASGRSVEGYTCNLTEVGFMPSSSFANFDTYENCAYYSDTIGAFNAEGGTVVVDVSDPRKPVQTAYLTERAAANAGESLRVHRERGLLVADRYFLAPGISNFDDPDANRSLAVYDISQGLPQAEAARRRDHAVGASATRAASRPTGWSITWRAPTRSRRSTSPTRRSPSSCPSRRTLGIHGCSTSEDGKRAYLADIGTGRAGRSPTPARCRRASRTRRSR